MPSQFPRRAFLGSADVVFAGDQLVLGSGDFAFLDKFADHFLGVQAEIVKTLNLFEHGLFLHQGVGHKSGVHDLRFDAVQL